MADEQPKKPSQPFFIGGQDQGKQSKEPVVSFDVTPHQAAAPTPAQNALDLMEQARLKQLADQKKVEQLRQVGFQVDMRHRRATNSLVTTNLWAAGLGIVLGFVTWKVTQ